MSKSLSVSSSKIYYGMASRYVKPSFVESSTILNEAFDLRDRTLPEKFVSFNLLNKSDENSMFHESIHFLKITPKENGAIIILDIKEALEEVNDEIENIIEFIDKILPHCGLVYLSKNLTKIQEAKTTLSYLAKDRFRFIKDIKNNN